MKYLGSYRVCFNSGRASLFVSSVMQNAPYCMTFSVAYLCYQSTKAPIFEYYIQVQLSGLPHQNSSFSYLSRTLSRIVSAYLLGLLQQKLLHQHFVGQSQPTWQAWLLQQYLKFSFRLFMPQTFEPSLDLVARSRCMTCTGRKLNLAFFLASMTTILTQQLLKFFYSLFVSPSSIKDFCGNFFFYDFALLFVPMIVCLALYGFHFNMNCCSEAH